METIKKVKEILQPDTRSMSFSRIDTDEGITLEVRHAQVAGIRLSDDAPEEVRSYFATLQNICLYGWFAYDLHAVVVFLSFTLIEMALRKRFPIKGVDKRTFSPLLRQAIKSNLIREKGFSHIRRLRQNQAYSLRLWRTSEKMPRTAVPKNDYVSALLKALPVLRNSFAHPRFHQIYLPGDALFSLQFAAEFINQLFAPTDRGCRAPVAP